MKLLKAYPIRPQAKTDLFPSWPKSACIMYWPMILEFSLNLAETDSRSSMDRKCLALAKFSSRLKVRNASVVAISVSVGRVNNFIEFARSLFSFRAYHCQRINIG